MDSVLSLLSSDDVFLYLVGGVALLAIPPVVGIMAAWTMFSAAPAEGRGFGRRAIGAIGLSLSVAFALAATGVSLIAPASPDIFIALLILCLIFGLLGAGKLYWEEEQV